MCKKKTSSVEGIKVGPTYLDSLTALSVYVPPKEQQDIRPLDYRLARTDAGIVLQGLYVYRGIIGVRYVWRVIDTVDLRTKKRAVKK